VSSRATQPSSDGSEETIFLVDWATGPGEGSCVPVSAPTAKFAAMMVDAEEKHPAGVVYRVACADGSDCGSYCFQSPALNPLFLPFRELGWHHDDSPDDLDWDN
jgi:hypothetical protein